MQEISNILTGTSLNTHTYTHIHTHTHTLLNNETSICDMHHRVDTAHILILVSKNTVRYWFESRVFG